VLQFLDFLCLECVFMPAARALLAAFCLLASTPYASAEAKYALLIGIDTYQPANTTVKHPPGATTGRFAPGAPLFGNLTGPTYDVASMRDVLTSSKFGFPNDDQHVHVLENDAATRAGILAAMNKYLVDQPQKGDIVVLYVAGHGSLRVNSKSNKQTFDFGGKPTPLENTIVPADAYLGTEDIRDRELARIFNKALDKGIRLTAIFDTCHSGGTARGGPDIGPRTLVRMLAYDPRDIAEAPDVNPDGTLVTAPEDRKDNAALVLAATQVDQKAKELPDSSPPHGVFTMALVDALQALPANIPAIDLWKRVQVDLEVQGFSDQQPVLDGSKQRKEQPLFGGEAEKGKVRAAVVGVDEDGIVLDIGSVADIGIGSEFVALAQGQGDKVTLRITAASGVTRSRATVISPAGAKVTPKEVFELSTWVPAEKPSLYFWVPASHLTQAQIASAVSEVRSSGMRLVNDPSLETWTHLISWDGAQWTIQKAGVRGADPLGATLSAKVLQRKLTKDAVVWLNPPPPDDLGAQLQMNNPQSAARSTANESQAMYVLAGLMTDAGPAYAWYNRGELIAGRQTPAGYGNGCSPDSPYPIRTDWIPASDAATTLKQSALKLAKLNGWLQLQSSVTGDDSDYPYHLALQRAGDTVIAEDKGKTYKGDKYQMILQARGDTRTSPRWVYVLAIDCQGKGQLMFPTQGGNNRYPQEDGRLEQIVLPGPQFRIGSPFGTDTYVLLSTSTQLSDPDALNFEGAVRRGGSGTSSPLENLLGSTSTGTRGSMMETPTDWGVEYLQMHSQPAKP
jgi:Caspase domain